MELDEFKVIIAGRRPATFSQSGEPDVASIIRKRKSSLVQSIRRSILLEILFAFLFIVFTCFLITRYTSTYIQLFGWGMLFLCVSFTVYMLLLEKKIRYYDTTVFSVRESLENLIRIISGFSTLYFQLTMIMLPLAFIFSFITVFLEADLPFGSIIARFSLFKILLYLSVFLGWCILMYFFTKWYIRKLYGDLLKQLRSSLKELLYN